MNKNRNKALASEFAKEENLMTQAAKKKDKAFEKAMSKKDKAFERAMSAFRLMPEDTAIETLTAHTLRRTMATKSLENGMNLHVLAKMLGHTDLQMLRKYAAVRKSLIEEQAAKYGVMDNL